MNASQPQTTPRPNPQQPQQPVPPQQPTPATPVAMPCRCGTPGCPGGDMCRVNASQPNPQIPQQPTPEPRGSFGDGRGGGGAPVQQRCPSIGLVLPRAFINDECQWMSGSDFNPQTDSGFWGAPTYAGLGIEALSRGNQWMDFLELRSIPPTHSRYRNVAANSVRVTRILGVAGIAASTGLEVHSGVVENRLAGVPEHHIRADAIADVAVSGTSGTLALLITPLVAAYIAGEAGAQTGSNVSPGYGTLIGFGAAFIAGLGMYVISDMALFGDYTIREHSRNLSRRISDRKKELEEENIHIPSPWHLGPPAFPPLFP